MVVWSSKRGTKMTTYPNYAATQRIQDLVAQFKPISLSDVNQSAGLMDRVDTKYVLSQAALLDTLSVVQADYSVLEVNGYRLNPYCNLYYDTDSFYFYRQHHNGASNRYKVRTREYLANQLSFIEIKHKTPLGRTCKSRQPADAIVLDDESNSFVKSRLPLGVDPLEPKLWNSFTRITLVNSQYQERITLDIDLDYRPYDFSETLELGGVAIAEVKQVERHKDSPFVSALRKLGYHPMSFSKYCIGTSLLYPVKSNRFKPSLTAVSRITN